MADGDPVSVRAEMPVLGIPRGQVATVFDSPAVRTMIANGYLTRLEAPTPRVEQPAQDSTPPTSETPETPGASGETEQATPARRRRRTNPSSKES